MKRSVLGGFCQLAALGLAIGSLVPGARYYYDYVAHSEQQSSAAITFVHANLLKYGIVALSGIAIGYLLFRCGSHLRRKQR